MKVKTDGMMRVGWASPSFPAHLPLGDDEHSYAFDGFLVRLTYHVHVHVCCTVVTHVHVYIIHGHRHYIHVHECSSKHNHASNST